MRRVGYPSPGRALAGLIVAPLIVAIVATLLTYPHLIWFVLIAMVGEIGALVIGLPLGALLWAWGHLRPRLIWPVLAGALIGSIAVVANVMLVSPRVDGRYDGFPILEFHHALFSGRWLSEFLSNLLIFAGSGGMTGAIAWALAMQPWRKSAQ